MKTKNGNLLHKAKQKWSDANSATRTGILMLVVAITAMIFVGQFDPSNQILSIGSVCMAAASLVFFENVTEWDKPSDYSGYELGAATEVALFLLMLNSGVYNPHGAIATLVILAAMLVVYFKMIHAKIWPRSEENLDFDSGTTVADTLSTHYVIGQEDGNVYPVDNETEEDIVKRALAEYRMKQKD